MDFLKVFAYLIFNGIIIASMAFLFLPDIRNAKKAGNAIEYNSVKKIFWRLIMAGLLIIAVGVCCGGAYYYLTLWF